MKNKKCILFLIIFFFSSLFLFSGIPLQITKRRVTHTEKSCDTGLLGSELSLFRRSATTRLLWFFHFELIGVCAERFPVWCSRTVHGLRRHGDNISSATGGRADDLIIQRRGNGRTGTHVVLNLSLYVIRYVALLARNKLVNYISYADVSLPLLSTFSRARTPCFFAV